jgi:hypothetical protein
VEDVANHGHHGGKEGRMEKQIDEEYKALICQHGLALAQGKTQWD